MSDVMEITETDFRQASDFIAKRSDVVDEIKEETDKLEDQL